MLTAEATARDHRALGVELAAAIRAGELTAREVVDAHIELIERGNPGVNAVVADRFDAGARRGRRRRRAGRRGRRPRRAAAAARRPLHDQGVVRGRRDAEHRRARITAASCAPSANATAVAAPGRRRRDPARGHQHLRADAVDRVDQPGLRAHQQRLRPRRAPPAARRAARAPRSAPASRRSGSAPTSAARSGSRPSSTASSATSRAAASSPTPATSRPRTTRGSRLLGIGPLARRAEDLMAGAARDRRARRDRRDASRRSSSATRPRSRSRACG